MNIREEMIADLYDLIGNNNLYAGLNEKCNEAFEYFETSFSAEEGNKAIRYLCEVDRNAFRTGAIAILDVMTGKEVQ